MVRKQFLVIGMGRFGQSVAKALASLGQEVLAVDRNEALVSAIAPHVTHAVQADATDEKVLASLGIRNFDVAVVTIGDNIQASILITMLCKEMGVGFVLAKARNELHGKVLQKTGADRVVFPERDMGIRVAYNLADSNILDYIEIAGDLRIVDVTPLPGWEGKSLLELDVRKKFGVNVIAIKKKNKEMNTAPHGVDVIEKDDMMIVVGNKESIAKLQTASQKLHP